MNFTFWHSLITSVTAGLWPRASFHIPSAHPCHVKLLSTRHSQLARLLAATQPKSRIICHHKSLFKKALICSFPPGTKDHTDHVHPPRHRLRLLISIRGLSLLQCRSLWLPSPLPSLKMTPSSSISLSYTASSSSEWRTQAVIEPPTKTAGHRKKFQYITLVSDVHRETKPKSKFIGTRKQQTPHKFDSRASVASGMRPQTHASFIRAHRWHLEYQKRGSRDGSSANCWEEHGCGCTN